MSLNSPAWFWLRWVSLAAHRLSLLGERGLLLLACRLLTAVVLGLRDAGSRSSGCSQDVMRSSCRSQALEHRLASCGELGSAAPQRVGFSQARGSHLCPPQQQADSELPHRQKSPARCFCGGKLSYHCPFTNALHHMEAKWIY